MNYTETPKEHLYALLKVLAIVGAVVTFVLLTIACESKSGHLNNMTPEKVVILDSYPLTVNYDNQIKYKVKRINKGVVTYIYENNRYESGDTIFHKFMLNE